MEYLTLSSQRKRTRCCWSCSSQTSEPCNFNKFSYNFCTCCGPFRSKDAVAGNTISKPKPEKCCTKYLLVIGICWHLHFNAAPHTTPPLCRGRCLCGLQGSLFFRCQSCLPRGGSNSFCAFPFANSFGLRSSHFLCCCFSFFAFNCPLLSDLCVLCNFLFTLLVACCFCYLNMPQYLAWQRQGQRQRQQNRYIYTLYTYVYVCAEPSSKDLLVTANNSVGFYVLCSHILSTFASLSVYLFLSLCLSLCLPAAFACFLWN